MKNIAGVDLNLMTAFEAMMLEGNVTRAAARIGLAQPSMSNALGRLRVLFDDQLFVRTPVGMHPTEKARAIAPLVSTALAALRSAINDAGIFDPVSSALTIRIATTDYGEFIVLPKVMQILRSAAPNMTLISVPFSRAAIADQLSRGDVDLAFNQEHNGSLAKSGVQCDVTASILARHRQCPRLPVLRLFCAQ